jgi:hypothetical protein
MLRVRVGELARESEYVVLLEHPNAVLFSLRYFGTGQIWLITEVTGT